VVIYKKVNIKLIMKKIGWIVLICIAIGAVVFVFMAPEKPGKLDTFAQCVNDSGATFYGAFWCPHCTEQKGLFGRSAKLLPYVECSAPNGQDTLPVCIEAGIESYPTWDFADGERMTGTIQLDVLAEKTSCELPQ